MRLSDARVSRRHARVRREAAGYVLEDLGSSNGTFLNGAKIDQACPLRDGDIVRIGPFEVRFSLTSDRAVSAGASGQEMAGQPPARPGDGPRLAVAVGAETLTLPVDAHLELVRALDLGDARLEGEAASLVRKSDGYWLEPTAGREPVRHNGRVVNAPVRLDPGDEVHVGPLRLEFFEDE